MYEVAKKDGGVRSDPEVVFDGSSCGFGPSVRWTHTHRPLLDAPYPDLPIAEVSSCEPACSSANLRVARRVFDAASRSRNTLHRMAFGEVAAFDSRTAFSYVFVPMRDGLIPVL